MAFEVHYECKHVFVSSILILSKIILDVIEFKLERKYGKKSKLRSLIWRRDFITSTNLVVRELIIAKKTRNNLLPLGCDFKLLLQSLSSTDDVSSFGTATVQCFGDPIAAIGERIDLLLHAIQGALSRIGGAEELAVDVERACLDSVPEVAASLRSVFGVERW